MLSSSHLHLQQNPFSSKVGSVITPNLDIAQGLFASPETNGSPENHLAFVDKTLSQLAAEAHRSYLNIAGEIARVPQGVSLQTLFQRLSPSLQSSILLDPVTIEALHGISELCPELDDWHKQVASPCAAQVIDVSPDAARHHMGGLMLVLLLKNSPDWTGEISLLSDLYGRIRFPAFSLNIELKTDQGMLAKEVVTLELDDRSASFRMQKDLQPFLVLERNDFREALFNERPIPQNHSGELHPTITPTLHSPKQFEQIEVCYDLIHSQKTQHKQIPSTELIQAIISSIRLNSPHIADEFQQFIRTIQVFEIAASSAGIIQSFSDPALPGVMGLNIAYDTSGSPQLAPFSFCWFGHELAHTKNYLIQNIAYHRGWQFFTNGEAVSPIIERYGRSLSMRTIFQLPYVHFYEWELLINFIENGFVRLPWVIEEDPIAIGNDLLAEIAESFKLIKDCIRLTPLGESAMQHFLHLFDCYRSRWSKIVGKPA